MEPGPRISDEQFAFQFVPVTEAAAIAAASVLGQGDRKLADRLATEAMRRAFDQVPISGTVVIGEGERDEAPMLYIGEPVGAGGEKVDIAVDPLEGTNMVATATENSIAVLAAAEQGGLFHAPDIYMRKLVVGPACRGQVQLEASVEENLGSISRCLGLPVQELMVVVLDRGRHEELLADLRRAGARVRLIQDGDLMPAVAATLAGRGVHAVMGVGGAPEGVLAAAAVRCLGGEMQGQLVTRNEADDARLESMGIERDRILQARDLAPGERICFVATGVTDGAFLHGVRRADGTIRTHTLVMNLAPRTFRFTQTLHLEQVTGEGPYPLTL